jgi:ribose transport system substrate-binding protein
MRFTGRSGRTAAALVSGALVIGALGACGSSDDDSDTGTGAAAASTGASTAAAPAATTEAKKVENIAFFGFAGANSFAQATWAGIQEQAAKDGVKAKFFDPNFDAAKQVSQMQNAIASGEYQAFVVQANDGNAVVPVIREAIKAGISVVAEFTPVGSDYSSIKPQVPGMIFVGEPPVANGTALGELGVEACADLNPCNVAYLEGNPGLPLDVAREKALEEALKADPNAKLVSKVVGGYTKADGLKAGQNVLQAHPDVNVIIGSSQALAGAEQAVGDAGKTGKVLLIGNGGSHQAVAKVKSGDWFATYATAEKTNGAKAAEIAIDAAEGQKVPETLDTRTLQEPKITKETAGSFTGEYDD